MTKTDSGLPPVPFPFIAQPETYHMAVRYYLDTVAARATEKYGEGKIPALGLIGIMRDDAKALQEAKKRGEIV